LSAVDPATKQTGHSSERFTSRNPARRALGDVKRHLLRRNVLGALACVGFDLLILWLALLAVHAHPTPGMRGTRARLMARLPPDRGRIRPQESGEC
jgi:hypothetical protein